MRNVSIICLPALAIASACSSLDREAPSEYVAEAILSNAEGSGIGSAQLIQTGNQISINLTISALEQGERAFHLHQTGSCIAPDFTSAGGHLNPFNRSHGKLSEDGKHLGDLPNVVVPESGSVTVEIVLEGDAAELLPILFDEDGTAVMLHAGPDDYISDPAGAAGPRIACGVLQRRS